MIVVNTFHYYFVMPLIVGLGNPGEKYTKTRHNIGFIVLDAINNELGLNWKEQKQFQAQISETSIEGAKTVLLKPMTYMNNSGTSVQSVAKHFGFAPCEIWVVYDDVMLPFGVLRTRLEGSAGGHNGIKSIINHLHAHDFVRFRFGVNEPPEAFPLDKWVLANFTKEEQDQIPELETRTARKILQCIHEGVESVTENLSE